MESTRKRMLARYRFKWLIRKVINNLHWLAVVEDDTSVDASHATWRKVKETLKVDHKGLLMIPAIHRTEEQKQIIYRAIGAHKCIRKYPPDVQVELAGCAYFQYVPSGRVVVRKGDEGLAMYIILSGEVSVETDYYDQFSEEWKSKTLYYLKSGEMFGEVSVFHGVPRDNTILTKANCEFIMLTKFHFERVLKKTVQELWDNIINALNSFTYFNTWNLLKKRECCIVAKIKKISKNNIILGGLLKDTNVHFVLSGKCVVVHCLSVRITNENGYEKWNFYDPKNDTNATRVGSVLMSSHETEEKRTSSSSNKTSTILKDTSVIRQSTGINQSPSQRFRNKNLKTRFQSDTLTMQESVEMAASRRRYSSFLTQRKLHMSRSHARDLFSKGENVPSYLRFTKLPGDVRTFFMQSHFYGEKACFNLGENLEDRYILATTDVEILLIPTWWLQRNSEFHTWIMIKEFIERHTKTPMELFQFLTQNRKWRDYTQDLFEHLTKPTPSNVINSIPYSLRIKHDYRYNENFPYK